MNAYRLSQNLTLILYFYSYAVQRNDCRFSDALFLYELRILFRKKLKCKSNNA